MLYKFSKVILLGSNTTGFKKFVLFNHLLLITPSKTPKRFKKLQRDSKHGHAPMVFSVSNLHILILKSMLKFHICALIPLSSPI